MDITDPQSIYDLIINKIQAGSKCVKAKMKNNLKGVFLDEASVNAGDLDLRPLLSLLHSWDLYPSTTAKQAVERVRGVDVVVTNKVVIDRCLIDRSPSLKVILLTATGMDNVDLQVCEERGISVYNVSDYCTPSVTQHVFSLILILYTHTLAYIGDARNGTWSRSPHFSILTYPIHELHGKTLGIVGYGVLGKSVVKLAQALGMESIIAQRPGGPKQAGREPLERLLPEVDILSLHCPLTAATRNLIGMTQFEQMKKSALLINTARGAIVDNSALAEALRRGIIGGAGIDVLEQEPPPQSHPLLAADIPNLILTPHIAWASIEARQRLIDRVANNLTSWLAERQ